MLSIKKSDENNKRINENLQSQIKDLQSYVHFINLLLKNTTEQILLSLQNTTIRFPEFDLTTTNFDTEQKKYG